MKNEQGFTLNELLIVVAIIAVIAAIAVPNLLDARMAANEASAVSALRSISSAQINRLARVNANGTLSQLVNEGLLDSRFNTGGTVNGYTIAEGTIAVPTLPTPLTGRTFLTGVSSYTAAPTVSNSTGRYNYIMGVDLVIRYNTVFPTTAASGTPIGNK